MQGVCHTAAAVALCCGLSQLAAYPMITTLCHLLLLLMASSKCARYGICLLLHCQQLLRQPFCCACSSTQPYMSLCGTPKGLLQTS